MTLYCTSLLAFSVDVTSNFDDEKAAYNGNVIKFHPIPDTEYDDDNSNKNEHLDNDDERKYLDDKESYIVNRRSRKMKEEIIGIIIGALLVLILVFVVIFVVIFLKNRRQKYHNSHRVMKQMGLDSFGHSYHTNDVILGMTNGKTANGYNIVSTLDVDSDRDSPAATATTTAAACFNLTNADFIYSGELQSRKLPELPTKTPDSTLSGSLAGCWSRFVNTALSKVGLYM